MASPFAAFRKYQALLLAVFGVLIIVVFTIGDSVSRMAGDPSGVTDEVVVKWDGMELKESRLNGLQTGRQVTLYGLSKVQDAAFAKGAFPQFQQQMTFARRFNPNAALPRPRMIFSEGDMTPAGTVRTMVLAQRARELGIKIPDSQIIQYLKDLTDSKLDYSEIYEILVGGKDAKYKHSIKSIFSVLREEMLANKVFEEFFRGTVAMPAAQQLDYFARLNRQIEADVVSVPVEHFIDRVAEPTDRELQAYFDKYKSQTPLFDNIGGVAYQSPDPGFKLPHRVSVEYVKVNAEELLDEVRDTITEEEIAAYYEENKQRDENMHATDDLLLPGEEDPAGEDDAPDGADEDGAADDSATGDDPAGGDGDNTEENNTEESNTEESNTEENNTEENSGSGDAGDDDAADGTGDNSPGGAPEDSDEADDPAAETADDPSAAVDPAVDDPGPTKENDEAGNVTEPPPVDSGSSVDRLPDGTFFALLQAEDADVAGDVSEGVAAEVEAETPPAAAEESAENDADANAEQDGDRSRDDTQGTTPPADAPAEAASAEGENGDNAATGGDGDGNGAAEATDEEGADAGTDEEAPPEVKFKPLDEVREYIRQEIAQDKAKALVDEKFAAIRKRMDSFQKANRYIEEGDIPSIKRPDFKVLAEKQGLEPHKIDLKSAWHYQRETDIGKSFQQEPPTRFNPYGSQVPYVQLIFRLGEQSYYVAKETQDDEGFRYLAWKVDERDAEIPELEGGVRNEVVRAWKTGAGLDDDADKARGLARQRAEELAKKVGDGTSMVNIAVEQKGSRALSTEAFSWLSQGSAAPANLFAPPPLRLSEIEEIEQPGFDFMRTAFGLDIEDVGVAMNHPQSYAYVIRPTFQNKGTEVVQKDFLDKMDDRFVAQQIASAAQLDWRQLSQEWFDQIDREMNVEWLKPEVRTSR